MFQVVFREKSCVSNLWSPTMSDDELPPRSQRAPRSKPTAPVTPIGSESDHDDAEEVEMKVDCSYSRPRIQWDRIIAINKGEMDDERKDNSCGSPCIYGIKRAL